jgi:molybdate transport system substrate-binding protein
MIGKMIRFLYLATLILVASGCSGSPESLTVYAGKGLKLAVDEIVETFKNQEEVEVSAVYAGSKTLLKTIEKTRKGDIYIPCSQVYLKQAGDLIAEHRSVATHIPTFAINPTKQEILKTYADLAKPGLRIAVGNAKMSAIGRVTDAILADSEQMFRNNIIIKASTVNELLQLVSDGEVDAALIWKDMLMWAKAKQLVEIEIPRSVNKPQEIEVAILSTSRQEKLSERFLDFAASAEARAIFVKHGFGE